MIVTKGDIGDAVMSLLSGLMDKVWKYEPTPFPYTDNIIYYKDDKELIRILFNIRDDNPVSITFVDSNLTFRFVEIIQSKYLEGISDSLNRLRYRLIQDLESDTNLKNLRIIQALNKQLE